jgi:hypothetical protein
MTLWPINCLSHLCSAQKFSRAAELRILCTWQENTNADEPLKASDCTSELGNWAMEQSVAEVPADLALCEFDCRKSQCSWDEWVNCERRISRAAGELMPCVRQEHAGNVRTIETDRELVGAT